ncbi:MAG: hypothetical protein ACTXOO_03505 [Sodalis sp. (in: enterobacteria)]
MDKRVILVKNYFNITLALAVFAKPRDLCSSWPTKANAMSSPCVFRFKARSDRASRSSAR